MAWIGKHRCRPGTPWQPPGLLDRREAVGEWKVRGRFRLGRRGWRWVVVAAMALGGGSESRVGRRGRGLSCGAVRCGAGTTFLSRSGLAFGYFGGGETIGPRIPPLLAHWSISCSPGSTALRIHLSHPSQQMREDGVVVPHHMDPWPHLIIHLSMVTLLITWIHGPT